MGEVTETERKGPPRNQGQNQDQGQSLSVNDLFRKMDTNKDDKLSKDEVKGPLANDFSKIDTNKDGFITKDELEKLPKQQNRRN